MEKNINVSNFYMILATISLLIQQCYMYVRGVGTLLETFFTQTQAAEI